MLVYQIMHSATVSEETGNFVVISDKTYGTVAFTESREHLSFLQVYCNYNNNLHVSLSV